MTLPLDPLSSACPVPQPPGDRVLLAHGEGARLARRLIRDELLKAFDNPYLQPLSDAAVLPPIDGDLVFTTDGSVVSPLFFPGGDIGKLAVHGAVNDLAVSGATPLWMSLAMILEEGLPLTTLRQVVASVAAAALDCGVAIVTGDTKVVPRGAADQMFLTMTGVGRRRPGLALGTEQVRPGDQVLVTGTLGEHGLAVLAARERLELGDGLQSDTAPLHRLVAELLASGTEVRWMRDPTRGGLSAALRELTEAAGLSVVLDEAAIPRTPAVRGACELLGLDPLYIANEGKLVAVVSAATAELALEAVRRNPLGTHAAIVGEVQPAPPGEVLVRGVLGALRPLDEPTGAPLPRIC